MGFLLFMFVLAFMMWVVFKGAWQAGALEERKQIVRLMAEAMQGMGDEEQVGVATVIATVNKRSQTVPSRGAGATQSVASALYKFNEVSKDTYEVLYRGKRLGIVFKHGFEWQAYTLDNKLLAKGATRDEAVEAFNQFTNATLLA